MSDYARTEASLISRTLTDARKKEVLATLSEEEFRDKVVRPLYRRLGFTHLRDTHGTDELGKDCLFTSTDQMGTTVVYAVQTKTGPVNMAGTSPSSALNTISNQLDMALKTPVILADGVTKTKPVQAHLCASGKVSESARRYLNEELDAHRIKVLGFDELIERIDQSFPEYWLGIDANRFPYLRAIRKKLCQAEDVIRISAPTGAADSDSPVLDGNYMRLRLSRIESESGVRITETKLRGGKTIRSKSVEHRPKFVDIAVEALVKEDHRLVLITGEGGAGKTTALRRIAITLIDKLLSGDEQPPLPVVIKAKQISSWNQGLLELVANEATELAGGRCPFTSDDLASGKVAVLIDAAEEVSASARAAALDSILEFNSKFPQCQVILTSRDYRSVLKLVQVAKFMHYWILPIGLEEVNGLVTRVVERKNIDQSVVRTTIKSLRTTHGFTLSPMMITVFLSSPDLSKQDVPPNVAEIFKKFTEQMIGRWDEKKGLSQQFEYGWKDFLLCQLAFQMHVARVRVLDVAAVQRIIEAEVAKRELPIDSDSLFDEVIYRSGLLRTDGNTIEWRHHLLQEYFAGRGVPNAEFFASVVSDEWWRTPMVFYFGDKPSSFAALWDVVTKSGGLGHAQMFDAAISIGLAVQACFLAETEERVKTLSWVLDAFARSMADFRDAFDGKAGGGQSLLALCAALTLGRDAIGTRTLAKVEDAGSERRDGQALLLDPAFEDRRQTWKIIGLLEAGELAIASEKLKTYRPADRDLVFMIHLAVAWTIYSQNLKKDVKKPLQQYIDRTGEVVKEMRDELFREYRTLLFHIKSRTVTPLLPGQTEEGSDDEDGG